MRPDLAVFPLTDKGSEKTRSARWPKQGEHVFCSPHLSCSLWPISGASVKCGSHGRTLVTIRLREYPHDSNLTDSHHWHHFRAEGGAEREQLRPELMFCGLQGGKWRISSPALE